MTIRRSPRRAPKPPMAPPRFVARHRAFTARLRRGAVDASAVPGITLTLRRLPVHVIERLHTLTRLCARVVERSAARGISVRVTTRTTPAAGRESVRLECRTLLERLVERRTHAVERRHAPVIERRIAAEAGATASAQAVERTAVARRLDVRHVYPPVARTLARAGAAPKSAAERHETPPTSIPGASPHRAVARGGTAPVTPEAVTLPPNELSRVTEHVIAQLDRRVRSYRERMGLI